MMKQSLQLRMGQQLTMTPQLQQAIKLLQLSTQDLQQEIQQALESNIMLEIEEETVKNDSPVEEIKEDNPDTISSAGSQTEIPDELPVDSNWDDTYETNIFPITSLATEIPGFETQHSKSESLQEHLLWQLELTPISTKDYAIAIAIIDAINKDGYLNTNLDDIYQGLTQQLEELESDEVTAVLHRVQNFEPVGVGAIDLGNCLNLQLRALPSSTAYRDIAIKLVENHIDLLAAQEQSKLTKKLGITEWQLEQVVNLIRTLNPKPGTPLQTTNSEYIIPDVFVSKRNGQWHVNLNPDIAPKLRINSFYSGMIKRGNNSQDNTLMKEHLQEAKWFIKSLYGRNETLLRVAKCIVEKQTEFLEHGAIAMKAMVLRDIAEELELHESTISRVTTQKYMHTPNGIMEFKYFFSSYVSTAGGGECSSTAIRAFMKELIANELPCKPLSDEKISILLQKKGIKVARRTVAKYREAMSISSSSQRKRLL